jgi:hypothetical protein
MMMKSASNIPAGSIEIRKNTYLNGIIDSARPERVVVFPYSQHFIIKQDLLPGELKNEEDLERLTKAFLSQNGFKTMSGEDIKKPLFKGIVAASIANISLVIFLLIMLLI